MIAIPAMDSTPTRFTQSLISLKLQGETHFNFVTNTLVYTARNQLAKAALEGDFDRVLWLDSDMVFQPNLLERLSEDLDGRDIVTGLYFKRKPPFTPVLFSKLELVGDTDCDFEEIISYPDHIFEVAGCGFGAVLMKTNVLRDILDGIGPLWFSPMGNLGEDIAFCLRARHFGHKIYCDPNIKLGHVGQSIVTEQVFLAQNLRRLKNGS